MAVGSQPIVDQRRWRHQESCGERQQRRLGEWPLRQAQVRWLTGLGGLQRCNERNLIGRSAPSVSNHCIRSHICQELLLAEQVEAHALYNQPP
ncbi:MAG: hypothetical protein IIZ92_27070 [Aquincola sp.]|nr:hypothetical protein [Aquincola sp.]